MLALTRLLAMGAAAIALAVCGVDVECCAQSTPPRKIDARRAAAAGIRLLEGRHVQLLTDVPSSAAVDELPRVFDAAVPEWAAYFDVPKHEVRGRWLAFLIQDRERFAALGLLPQDNPNFVNGYSRGYELWLVEQPSDYYRRHLMLHEGTHAFMQTQLGGCGPPWYMEGVAELLGTHAWRDGRLRMGVFPGSRDDFPMWGRIKLVRDAVARGEAWSIDRVLAVDNSRELSTESYAWTWALAAMLHHNPKSSEKFRNVSKEIRRQSDITGLVKRGANWESLYGQWQAFVSELDYGGYDFARMEIVNADESPIVIDADRGWQSTDQWLAKGHTYRITASGRYEIASGGEKWPCEPGGITIEYHNGKPLGMLLAAAAQRDINELGSLAQPTAIGLESTITPDRDGLLLLRVNEAPMGLADNRGELTVRVEEVDRK